MIFVTIGVMYGFGRLVMKMDELASRMSEPVIIQIGETEYEPKNAKYFRFSSRNEMEDLYRKARIIVGHAGVGTILKAAEYKKPMILVPRMKKYGEHINDHQLEITKELEQEGRAKIVYNIEDLESALHHLPDIETSSIENKLVKNLKEYMDQILLDKRLNGNSSQ
jgi:beta-1,4-N-acetylglucosaminyltransferase